MEVVDLWDFFPCFSIISLPSSYSMAASPGLLWDLNNLFLYDMLTVYSM
jgi:hypothetical protein